MTYWVSSSLYFSLRSERSCTRMTLSRWLTGSKMSLMPSLVKLMTRSTESGSLSLHGGEAKSRHISNWSFKIHQITKQGYSRSSKNLPKNLWIITNFAPPCRRCGRRGWGRPATGWTPPPGWSAFLRREDDSETVINDWIKGLLGYIKSYSLLKS